MKCVIDRATPSPHVPFESEEDQKKSSYASTTIENCSASEQQHHRVSTSSLRLYPFQRRVDSTSSRLRPSRMALRNIAFRFIVAQVRCLAFEI